ncbi:MAG: hypothetical protein HFI29_11340 [Lachnospiraceae bacterium]|jgi:hypothetical protein|nr:hypothetical protein [Lachnospiraceae bacterium]
MTGRKYGIIEKIIAAAAAFLAVAGFHLLYGIRGESTMFSNSVLCMAAFGAFLLVCLHVLEKSPDRRTLIFALIGGFLAAAMTAMGCSLHYTDTIWHGRVFLAMVCLTPFFGCCVGTGLLLLWEGGASFWKSKRPGKRWFFLCWLFLLLCWVPVLLASWPGIFSYDCGWQLVSFVDGTVTGHHPILHTFLLGICRQAGRSLFGSNQAGAAIYSLLQMGLLSSMYAYVCWYLKKRQAPGWLQIGTFVFFGIHPVNGMMALCATKDSLFTGVFAVFLVQLFEMAEEREAFFSSLFRQIAFCVTIFFLFALRNNGFHTFLLCIPFLLWAFWEYWKRMGLLILICLSLYALYTGPVYGLLGVEKGDPREMCSVLMQSAARVYNLDPEGLTEEEREAFLSIIEEEGMQSYLSWFADPVKAYFNGKKFRQDPGPFLKAWLSAGMRHKRIYIDSFLANTFGYWYPGNSIPDTERGRDYFEYTSKEFREDVDVVMESKLPALSAFYESLGNESSFQRVPVVAATFNLGTYTWLMLFALLLLLYRLQYRELVLLTPLLMYYLTTLLGPVVKMRYHYPLIACAPLLIFLIWRRDREWIK